MTKTTNIWTLAILVLAALSPAVGLAAPASRPTSMLASRPASMPASRPVTASACERVTLSLRRDASVVVRARWAPMVTSGMKLDQNPKYARYYRTKVAVAKRRYGWSDLRVFLPPSSVTVGDVWRIPEASLHRFFSQFHPNVRTRLHNGGPDGAYVAVRAIGPRFVELAFRVHVEFALKLGAVYYTPAQFAGRLVLDRRTRSVVLLRMALPTHRSLNVDLNADRLIDVVYVPRMELVGGDASRLRGVRWSRAVAWKTIRRRLSQRFYAFMKIRWHTVAEALKASKTTGKPMHLFVVFGSLDDQSC